MRCILADPVIVAILDAFHLPAFRRALAAGTHVFDEKPIGLSAGEVEAPQPNVAVLGILQGAA